MKYDDTSHIAFFFLHLKRVKYCKCISYAVYQKKLEPQAVDSILNKKKKKRFCFSNVKHSGSP